LGTGGTSRVSVDRTRSRDHDERTHADPEVERPVDSGLGSSPALTQINDELAKDLEAAKSENAWFASELALARKAGYNPSPSNSSLLDGRAADTLGDEDRPLIEALLLMRAELANVQGSIDKQAIAAASKIAEIGKQRDAAINEAVLAKAKLAAQCGSH
ncbi:Negative regulator of mitotic exit, partial [Cryomyces antarcticus]